MEGKQKKVQAKFKSFIKGYKATQKTPMKSTEWTQIQGSRKGGEFENLEKGPEVVHREVVENTYVAFCEFSQGNGGQGRKKSRNEFLKHVFNLLRHGDKRLAILPYNAKCNANSITHASHIPENENEFAVYFPKVMYYRGQLTIKCRITSSVNLWALKNQIFSMLTNYHYFLRPTTLRALQTAKIGWFFAGHPDLSFRPDFHKVLQPLIVHKLGIEYEFQVEPENERRTVQGRSLMQRVLMARCDASQVEELRDFFMEIFQSDNMGTLETLCRYTFVLAVPMGTCTESQLQNMLYAQKRFRSAVHYYVVMNLTNIDTKCKLKSDNQANEVQEDDVGNEYQIIDKERESEKKTNVETDEEVGETQESEVQEAPVIVQQSMSIRDIMYGLEANEEPLIHGFYPSSVPEKSFVLCKPKYKHEVLEILHSMEDILDGMFEPEAKSIYMENMENATFHVKDYPRITKIAENYASRIIDITGDQDEEELQENMSMNRHGRKSPPRNSKRTRSGELKTMGNEITSVLPMEFNDLLVQTQRQDEDLKQTMEKLSVIEGIENRAVQRFETLEEGLQVTRRDIGGIGQVVAAQGRTLETLKNVQAKQGSHLTKVSEQQNEMTKILMEVRNKIVASPPYGEGGMEE